VKHLINSIINGPAHFTVSHHLSEPVTLVIVLGCLFGEITIVWLVVLSVFKAIQNIRPGTAWLLRRCGKGIKDIPHSFLQLTFPADTTKSAYATEQLHILMRGHIGYSGRLERWAAQPQPYSLELVGTNDEGIRFVLKIPTFAMDTVRRNLLSYLPGLKIAAIDDYLVRPILSGQPYRVTELILNNDFVLPLKDHKALAEHDHMAYLTGHMTKLLPKELIAFQTIVVPIMPATHTRVLRRIRYMQNRIALRQEVSSKLQAPGYGVGKALWSLLRTFMTVTSAIIMFFAGMIQAFIHNDLPESMKSTNNKQITDPYEQELHTTVKTKLDQPLYEVSIRILVVGPDMKTINERIDAIVASFRPFGSSHQSIGRRRSLSLLTKHEKGLDRFQKRTITPHLLLQRPILSSSELADLYHFPNTDLTKTAGLVKSRSQELPAPLSITHSKAKLDVTVGINEHGGEASPIGMTLEQRQKHTYVIGKTGTGKTTLLKSSIYQDMVSGKGLAVLDPHGDMFRELLELVPEHRQKDVIIFDPYDRKFPIGLNILDPGIHFENPEDSHGWIASSIQSVFTKLADESFWGPRMEHILRSSVLTALKLPNPSLYTVQRLLTDKHYQRRVAAKLKDPVLKQFWQKELLPLGNMQLANTVAPLTNRLGHFISDELSRNILLQEKSTISISDIMDEGKILLVNLSKGDIGEDPSSFFGTMLTSLIWMAAFQRTKIPEAERRDFFVYIDEFQNFATPRFSEISSEGRKFHVALIVSHQNIAQIEDHRALKTMAGNSHSIICLKASPEDEAFILPYMEPVVEKGDIVNLAPYHFFMKTTAEDSEDAFSGTTVPLDERRSAATKKAVIAYSRQHYATPRTVVEQYLNELLEEKKPGDTQPDTGSTNKDTRPRIAPKEGL
jgi:hypothetical protein